jgi:release factor glutamine methyltransferase
MVSSFLISSVTRRARRGILPWKTAAVGTITTTTQQSRRRKMGYYMAKSSSSSSSSINTTTKATVTIGEIMDDSISKLNDANVEESELSVRHLLASSMTQLSWETGFNDVMKMKDQTISTPEIDDFTNKLQRRLNHEPIQYILGQWDFLDYTVTIKPPLLCPRPETEELVTMIVDETTESPIHILDVGAGTGIIGIALADRLPDATVEAIDIEPVAVETSMENAKKILLGKRKDCYKATLVSAQDYDPDHRFDIVVSNPPYIPRADMETLSKDVVGFESDDALCGGTDGMDVIRMIIHQLPNWCNSGAVCWMEVDPSHPDLIREWLESSPSLSVNFDSSYKDMFGKDRFVKLSVR